jgi:hypothetical protein
VLLAVITLFFSFSVNKSFAQCSINSSASLQSLSLTGYNSSGYSVAYNPQLNVYYVASGNYIRTFTSSGTFLNQYYSDDVYSIWWNSNLNQLEGKYYGSYNAIRSFSLNSSGYPISSAVLLSGSTIAPNSNYAAAYDDAQNELIYAYGTTIYRYSRATGAFIGTSAITGLPSSYALTNYTVMYTGCPGKEIALYDRTNRRVLFVNKTTYAYVGASQLPSNAPTPYSFNIAYANDRFWIANGTIWNSYDILSFGLQTSNIVGPYCDGSTVSVNFSLNSTTYNSGNIFTAQLSDATGSFTNPVNLGNVTSTTAQTITGTIPTGTAYGAGYRIRVVSSNPIRIGSDNGTSININVPNVNLGVDFSQCPGDTTTLTAPIGALSYTWSTGATSQSIDVTTAGTYRVTVSNGVCSKSDTIVASALAAPSPTLADTVSSCAASVTLNPGTFTSYEWSTGATTSTLSASSSGTYTVTVTGSNTCEGEDEVFVNLLDAGILGDVDTSICAGDSVELTSSGCYFQLSTIANTGVVNVNSQVSAGDDHGGIAVTPNYVYYVGNSYTARYTADLSSYTTFSLREGIFSDLASGQLYTFWNTNYNNFYSSTSITSNINAIRTMDASLNYGSTITLSQSINAGNSSMVFTGSGFVVLYSGNNQHFYKIELPSGTVTDLGAYNLYNIKVNSESWASWGIAECNGTGHSFLLRTATNTVVGTTNGAITRFDLNSQSFSVASSFSSLNLSSMACITYSPWHSRWYYQAEYSNSLGSYNENLGYANATHNGNGGVNSINSFSWNTGATSPTITVSPTTTTSYSVTVSHQSVSCSDTIQVTVNTLPSISLTDTLLECNKDSIQLDAGSGFSSYSWSTGETTRQIQAKNSGKYFVTVGNSVGCVTSDSILVELLDARIDPGDTTICSADSVAIGVGSCGVQVNSLSLSSVAGANLQYVGTNGLSFDDNSGIAATQTHVIVSGDYTTVKYSNDLSTVESYNFARQGIFSDLNTGELYSFWNTNYSDFFNNYTLLSGINAIRRVNESNLAYGQTITLSQTINANNSTRLVAAGGGYVLLYAYPTLYKISLPDGQVEVLSTNLYLNRYNSEGWAAYGVAECNEDSYNLVYRYGNYLNGTYYPIVRFDLSNSITSVVQSSASGFGDAANITVSPWANKWFFNTESSVTHFGLSGFEKLVSFDAQVENSFNSSYGGADVLWSTSDSVSSIYVSPSSATDYSVAVTSNYQTCRDTVSISVNASPAVSDSSNNLSCFGDTTGYVGVSVSSGVAPYSYAWSNGDTVATLSNVSGGTYIYTVTGDNGCIVSDSLTVSEPTELIVSTTILEETDCPSSSDGKAEITATGGTGALTYTWPSGSNDTIDSNLVTGLNIVTVTDANGCSVYDSITINANAQLVNPGPITSTSTFLCPGGTTSLFAANADSGVIAYKRLSDTLRTTNAYNTLTISMANLPAIQTGNPMLIMHYKGDLDAYNEYLNVRDENNQYIGRNYTTTNCNVWQKDTIFLTQTQVSNWLLDGQATFNVLPYYAYYVNGCTYDYEIALELVYNSDIAKTYWFDTPTTDTTLAIGTGSTASVTANATTTTFYAATFGGGCSSTFDSITILVPPKPVSTYTLNPSSICSGDTTQVTASGAVSYTWPNDPTISGSGTSATVSPVATTDYLVTVTDFFGCAHVDTMTVDVNQSPTANLVAVTPVSCQSNNDGTAAVFGTGGTSPYTYSWPDGSTSALKFALAQGAYVVTVTDNNQCSDTITINVDGPTPIDFGAVVSDISCNGQQDGSISLSPSGGVAPYTYMWSNGSTGTSLSSLSANTYSVTVTDASNCSNDTSFTIVEPLPIVASIANSSDESCPGSANGSITAGVTGGTAPFTYTWSNGGSGMILTGLSGGTYTVTVTDAGGCTSTSVGTIATQPTSITIAFNGVLDATCFGESTGAATALATGGNAPYTYAWSNGATIAGLNGVTAGTYTVVATDAVGCQANNTVTINQPTAIVSSVSGISDVTCAGGVDGAATVNVSGGIAPYTYSWNNGGISATNTLLMAGANTVTVTDANGCVDTVDVQINEPVAIALSASVTPVSCSGANDAEVSVTVSGGTTPYAYAWSTGATTNTISGLAGANYTVTITDNNGCVKDSTFIITEPTALSASITDSSNITCFGETDGWAVVEGTGGSLPYTYNWTNGSSNDTLSGVAAGTYSVTLTDAGGCTVSTTVQLTEPSTPFSIAISSSIDVTCFGASTGQATVAATGGVAPITYLWSNGITTNAITSVTAGTYTVTATDASGCERTTSVDILEPTELMVQTTSAQDETCASAGDGSITVSASGGTAGYTYNWSNGSTTASISGLSLGGYTVTVTDANGCQVTLDTAVSAPAPIVITVDSLFDVYCHGASDGYISTSATGGTMPYSYAWSTGETTNDAIGLAAGTYTITITDANGCSVTSSSTVAEPAELMASTTVEIDNVCNAATNGIGIVSGTGGTMPYSYSWPTSSIVAHDSNLAAGSYVVTITDANGCSDTTLVTIAEPSALAISMVANTPVSCNGLADGSYIVGVSGGTAPYTYAWSNGDADSVLSSVTGGSYTLTVTDGAGCTSTYTATVNEPAAIVINGTVSDISCNGASDGTISLNTSGGTSGYSYAWSNSASSSILTGLAAGSYTVTVTDANSCTEIDTFTVAEPLALAANATVDSIIYCFGYNSGGVSANPTGGTAPFTYAWDNGAITDWQAGLTAGTYTVTVTDMNGCTSVDSAILTNPTQLVVTSSVDSNVSCNGLSNGGASLAVSGGTTPYSYAWNNGDTTSSITGLSAGVYNYTVTDTNYCYVSGSVTITQPAQIAVATQIDSLPNCFGDSDAGATAIATGGVGVFSYEWSSGQLTDVITGISSGTYSVTATDASGCTGIGSVTIADPAQIDAVVNSLADASCFGVADGEAEVVASGGTAPYSFEWSNGEVSAQNTSLSGGENFVTTTDVYGCAVVDTIQITQPDSIEFVFTITDVTCEGDTVGGNVLVTVTGGNGGESFQWANGTAGDQVSNVSTGNYEVTVTDMNGCTNSDVATVGFANPLPVVDLGSDTAYGAPSLITLTTGNTVDNHVWSTGATGSSLELDFVQDTTVWVTVTSAAGCVNSDTVNIDALLGVKGISKPFTVSLYPNPTQGDLNIEINENTADNITIQVVDFTGKLVSTKEWNSMGTVVRESLDLNELSQGTYFVNVILDGERYTERITVY